MNNRGNNNAPSPNGRLASELLRIEEVTGVPVMDAQENCADLGARVMSELDELAGGTAPLDAQLLASLVNTFALFTDLLERLEAAGYPGTARNACAEVADSVRSLLPIAVQLAEGAKLRQPLRCLRIVPAAATQTISRPGAENN